MQIDYGQLARSVQQCRYVMRVPRANRVELAREVAGHRYAEGGTQYKVKVNLLALYQQIIGGMLIANEPRYLLTALGGIPPYAVRTEQDWTNEQVVRIRLADTLGRGLVDGLYLQGVVKVALTTPADAVTSAWGVSAGEPGAWVVDPDDWVWDVNGKEQSAFEFEGHVYDCPVDVAVKAFGSSVKKLGTDEDRDYNPDGDERIGRIVRGMQTADRLQPVIRLYELYLPRHRQVVVIPFRDVVTGGNPRPLWEKPWVGHQDGPYVHLVLGRVPGQALGIGPMQYLYEQHCDFNNVARKQNNMVRRMKEVTAFRRKNDADAKALAEASDGDFVPLEEPGEVANIVSGGKAIGPLQVVMAQYKELFDFVSNLSLVGGRGPMAKTATQEKILNENAGAGLAVMTRKAQTFTAQVGERLLFLSHNHPQLTMRSDYRIPGTGFAVPRQLPPPGHPQGRNWDMRSMRFQLDPYSIAHKSPEERLAFLDAAVQKLLPIAPLLAQQGLSFDAKRWVEILAELGQEPRLNEVFTAATPLGQGQGGGATETPHTTTLPAQTERTYTRQNVAQDKGSQSQQLLAKMSAMDLGGANEG